MPDDVILRAARDADADELIALIGGCFAEYPGCVLDVDGELPELRAIATAYREWNGMFWVGERAGRVVGSVGFTPAATGPGLELRKLYVSRDARKNGLGGRLCALVETEARRRGAAYVDLWSDTRFETAHAFYARRGYVRGPVTRALHDLSASVEYYFRKAIDPI